MYTLLAFAKAEISSVTWAHASHKALTHTVDDIL